MQPTSADIEGLSQAMQAMAIFNSQRQNQTQAFLPALRLHQTNTIELPPKLLQLFQENGSQLKKFDWNVLGVKEIYSHEDMKKICEIIRVVVSLFPQLEEIDFSHTQLEDETLQLIATLPLRRLNLQHAYVSVPGFNFLSRKSIEHININCCHFFDRSSNECPFAKGLTVIASMPLRFLDMSVTLSTDEHLKILSQGRIRETLQSLNLADCDAITDAGMQYLLSFPLKYLNLTYTGVTEKGLEILSQKKGLVCLTKKPKAPNLDGLLPKIYQALCTHLLPQDVMQLTKTMKAGRLKDIMPKSSGEVLLYGLKKVQWNEKALPKTWKECLDTNRLLVTSINWMVMEPGRTLSQSEQENLTSIFPNLKNVHLKYVAPNYSKGLFWSKVPAHLGDEAERVQFESRILSDEFMKEFSGEKGTITLHGKRFHVVGSETANISQVPTASCSSCFGAEIILLDPENAPLLNAHYKKLKHLLENIVTDQSFKTDDILRNVTGYVRRSIFPSCEDPQVLSKLYSFIANQRKDPSKVHVGKLGGKFLILSLDTFIEKDLAVCRHHAYTTAYLLDKLSRDKELPLFPLGIVQHMENHNHAWVNFIEKGKKWHIDTFWNIVQEFSTEEGQTRLKQKGYGEETINDQMRRTKHSEELTKQMQ